jgi:quinone-modifying oxidoreductase subunit QmoB
MGIAIRLYICAGCGIEEAVDVHSLAKMAEKEPDVQATRHPFLCNDEGLREALRMSEGRPHRILIAACSPRVKMDTFCFDPSKIMVERVNLREHVAWSHEPKPAEGDRFDQQIQMLAEDQVRMGLAKLRAADVMEASCAECSMRILVVGGGVAGMTAALEAGRAGYDVLLVEKEAELGGFASMLFKQFPNEGVSLESSTARVKSLIEALQSESAVQVMTSARVQKITGAPGMFDVLVEHRGSTRIERVGAIVMAVGFEPYDATRLQQLGFGKSPNIVTSVTIEKMATEARFLRPSDGQEVKSAAFVLCAGSREDDHLPYCSTTCCMTSLKQALYIREHNPDSEIYIFYRDMRTPGLYERFFWRMQEEKRVSMVRGGVAAVLPEDDGAITIHVQDRILGQKIRVQVVLVILATEWFRGRRSEKWSRSLSPRTVQTRLGRP